MNQPTDKNEPPILGYVNMPHPHEPGVRVIGFKVRLEEWATWANEGEYLHLPIEWLRGKVKATPSAVAATDVQQGEFRHSYDHDLSKAFAPASSARAPDPDHLEFLAEAHKQLECILNRGDIEAVRWMIQTAADYHDNQESAAESMDVIESAEYHRKRREELTALLAPSASRATDLLKEVRPYLDLIAPSVSKERPLVMVTTKCDAEALAKRIDAFIGEPS